MAGVIRYSLCGWSMISERGYRRIKRGAPGYIEPRFAAHRFPEAYWSHVVYTVGGRKRQREIRGGRGSERVAFGEGEKLGTPFSASSSFLLHRCSE